MGWPEGPNVIQRPILLPVMTLLLVSIAEILSVSPVWIVLKEEYYYPTPSILAIVYQLQ